MIKDYSYTKTPVDNDRLTLEIQTSSITIALERIDISGENLTIYFKTDLSNDEKTVLDGIVSEHTGEHLPSVIPVQKVELNSPKALDMKPFVQTTPRPIGTFSYWCSEGDAQDTPEDIARGETIAFHHQVGDPAEAIKYLDINAIRNDTYIHGSFIQWDGAKLDKVEAEICTKVSPLYAGTGTSYMVVSGVLVQVPAGYGNIATPVWDNMNPIQMVKNEHGYRPPGYWDCTYNSTTKKFENFIFRADGSGEFNIFSEEVELNCFLPAYVMLGNKSHVFQSYDVSQLGHNFRVKVIVNTIGTDHEWFFCGAISLYRKKTV